MWWSENASRERPGRRALLRLVGGAALALPLAGCFRPMLAEQEPSAGLIGRVTLPPFDDRFGYYLDSRLRDRLGEADSPDYRLEIRTRLKKQDLAIAPDNAVTRISLAATADWALFRDGAKEPVLKGRTVSQSGYNSTASLFATRAVKLDIERRLAIDLGERISRALFARAGQLEAAPGKAAVAGS